METRLTPDDDIASALKERARLLNTSFAQVVNEALRRGISVGAGEAPPSKYRVVPNRSALAPGIDPLKLNQLNDELEAGSFDAPVDRCPAES